MPNPERGARAPEVIERLERSRDRLRQRRARERQREKEIKAAVADHIAAWQAINAVEARRDTEIDQLRTRIGELEAAATEQVAAHRNRQAAAIAVIKHHGETDDGIAELLEITPRQVRQFLAAVRAKTETTSDETPLPADEDSEPRQPGTRDR